MISIIMNDTQLLRQYIQEVLGLGRLVSHSSEPTLGNTIINTNPGCKHYKSAGKVLSIDSLDGGIGKTVTYLVVNDGENFVSGDVLTKTLDQVEVIK